MTGNSMDNVESRVTRVTHVTSLMEILKCRRKQSQERPASISSCINNGLDTAPITSPCPVMFSAVCFEEKDDFEGMDEIVSLGLFWPVPDQGPIETVTPAGRYACLWAVVSVFGAVLVRDARGALSVICPAPMPPGAAQAARDGFAELAGYIADRMTANNRS